jgi:hypothetical protein
MTVDEYFMGQDFSRHLFDSLSTVVNEIGPVQIHVTKSQVSFNR